MLWRCGGLAAVAPCLLLLAACVREIPPPATPEAVPPPMGEAPPVPEGHGRLIVDVVDGPTEVRRMSTVSVVVGMDKDREITASTTANESLCVAPCIVDLPLGRHVLAFPMHGTRRLEMDTVTVGESPTVYRRALGRREGGGAGLVLGILGATFGGMSMVTGMVLLPVGLANDSGGLALAGGITLGAGASLTTLGIVGIAVSPTVHQPGASVQFTLQ